MQMSLQQRRRGNRANCAGRTSPPNGPAATERQLRRKTERIIEILEAVLGNPEPPGKRSPPLDILVATILSQNTNDKNSHRAYTALRRKYPRWQDVARAPLRSIESSIRRGGMARQKSERIKGLLCSLQSASGGPALNGLEKMSEERALAYLTGFKGVGVKTAACVLLFSLGREVFPVDTHVHRLCTRLGLVPRRGNPDKTFEAMRPLVPRGKAYSFHTNLIRFGRLVCRAGNPACSGCPLYDLCSFPGKRTRAGVPRGAATADHNFMLLDNV